MKNAILVLLLLCVFLGRDSSGQARDPSLSKTITLSGFVRDPTGNAINGAEGNTGIVMAQLPGGAFGPRLCVMNVFLDGVLAPWANEVGIDNVISQSDVKAIEVYNRPSLVPNVIQGIGGFQASTGGGFSISGPGVVTTDVREGPVQCGAILLWTKPIQTSEAKKN